VAPRLRAVYRQPGAPAAGNRMLLSCAIRGHVRSPAARALT
jgi:hypothetical protein